MKLSATVLALSLVAGPTAALQPAKPHSNSRPLAKQAADFVKTNLVASCLILTTATSPVFADELGVEKEAPTLYTGETVEICTKRGPLGACLKTEFRTEENDNDKAKKYFRDPAIALKEKNQVLEGTNDAGEANALIEKLKKQTEDNKEKNRLDVERRTFENDQSATFGPFDSQVVIMNTDGKTFTLLKNPQAMRLKKAGFIQDRKFVKQPTPEEIEQALEPEGDGLAGALSSMFGGN